MPNTAPQTVQVGLTNLKIQAEIGIDPSEIGRTQPLELDILLTLAAPPHEDLLKTVDYTSIARFAHEMGTQPTGLIEAFGHKLATHCYKLDNVIHADVVVRKPQAITDAVAQIRVQIG